MITEHSIQSAFIEWCNWNAKKYKDLDLYFAVPNMGKRNYKMAQYLKNEGMKKGVPDIWIPVKRGRFSGLIFEFKTEKGKLTPEQEKYLSRLTEQGFLCQVVRTTEEAIKITERYFSLKY